MCIFGFSHQAYASTATFVKSDTTTQGNWKGVYGGLGWSICGDTSSNNPTFPSFATVTLTGQTGSVPASSTIDVRAPSKAANGSADRVAGLWYSATTETFDVNITDGTTRQIALYALDWGNNGRAESMTITDAVTSATLDTRSLSGFYGGVYEVWTIAGHVKIAVTYTGAAGGNAVVSGIFLGVGSGGTVPAAPAGLTATPGTGQVTLNWTSVSGLTYNVYRGTTAGGENPTPIATGLTAGTYTDIGLTSGTTYYYKVVAVNSVGGSAPSSEVSAVVVNASATFVKPDTTTQGNWKGVYGGLGWSICGDTSSNNPTFPSFATVTLTGQTGSVPASSTIDVRAPLKAANGSADRVAGLWYSATTETFDVNITDGTTRQFAMYMLDWGGNARVQSLTITDAVTNANLDTRSASSFNGGLYDVWNIAGHVKIAVTYTGAAGSNAAVSGIFLGVGSGGTVPAAPAGLTATPGTGQVTLNWTSVAGLTYNVYRGTTAGGENPTPIATGLTAGTYTDTGLTSGTTYYYKVVAVNSVGGSAPSSEVSAVVVNASATFVKSDTTTQGNWKGVYGGLGWSICGDTSSNNPTFPSYATVTLTGQTGSVPASSTIDVRAPLKAANGSADRVAGLWYSATTETFDVNITDGTTRQFAMYMLDWGGNARVQSLTITDAVTNATLDTRSASSFNSGLYDVWNIQGHVKIAVAYTGAAGGNAAISGMFLGVGSGGTVTTPPTGLSATAGNGQVTLNWTAVSGQNTYNVYRGTSSGGEGATPIATGLSSTTYTNAGLTNGTTYYYRVVAVNSVGGSGGSNEASATPTLPPPPPTPTSVSASAATGRVDLSWSASTGATSYNIYRSTSSGGEGSTPVWTGIQTAYFTDQNLTNDQTYYYKIAAVNGGGVSAQSTEVSATPMSIPTGVTAVGANGKVTITWNAVPNATYNVYRGSTSGGEGPSPYVQVGGTSYTDTAVTNGTTYYYQVQAYNWVYGGSYITSDRSAEVAATPTDITVTVKPINPTISQSSSAGPSANCTITATTAGSSATISYSVSGLPSGITDWFSSNSITLLDSMGGTKQITTLYFCASNAVTVGSYPVTISANCGSYSIKSTVTLTVTN